MTIANKGNKPFNMKDLFPVTNLTDQKPSMHMTENTNSIAGLGWKTVASKSLAAVSEVFAPLDRYTTDYTDEIVTFGPGRAVTLTIEIAREVGEALKIGTFPPSKRMPSALSATATAARSWSRPMTWPPEAAWKGS